MVQQLALGSEGDGRVVGGQDVADAAAATELDAFSWFSDQAQACGIKIQLSGQPLHDCALPELFALDCEGYESERIIGLRRIGLQVDPLELPRLQVLTKKLVLLLGILPDEKQNGLAGAHKFSGKESLGEAEIFRLLGFVRRNRQ